MAHWVLEKSGFQKKGILRQSQFWKGIGIVDLTVYAFLQSDLKNRIAFYPKRGII